MENLDNTYKVNLITTFIKTNSLCGSKVEKKYINTSKPYKGEVTDIAGAKYKVLYEDGMEEILAEAEVQDIMIKNDH
jgi:ppGpp synthetase/RelA/SpoT-type nucleotidyltranferase